MNQNLQTQGSDRVIPTYEALALDLKSMGIECVFGLMSDDTAMFVVTLDAIGIRFYGARHENHAIAMAEGYSTSSGKLGIAVVGRGPAMANGLHAAVYASRTGAKVMLIYGDANYTNTMPNGQGPDNKGWNASAVLECAGIRTFRPTSSASARILLRDAASMASKGTATALLLPEYVQLAETTYAERPAETANPAPDARTRIESLPAGPSRAALALLNQARKPVIIAGYGAYKSGAKDAIARFADRIGAVVGTTWKSQGMFTDYPFNIGITGAFAHSAARKTIERSDCVIVIGAGLNKRTSDFGSAFPPGVPIIHIDSVRENIGRWHHADVAIVGDARQAVEQLAEALPERAAEDKPFHGDTVRTMLAEFDPLDDFEVNSTPRTLDPRLLAIELNKILPKDRNIIWDIGNFDGAGRYLSVPGPRHVKITGDFASVGMGFGTALGFAVGDPDRANILMIGDGGFFMTMGELETTAREGLPLVVIVMNDCAYGAETHFLKARNMPVERSLFPDVDIAPIAEALGFETWTVRNLDDLQAAAASLADPQGPILVDCKINGAVQR